MISSRPLDPSHGGRAGNDRAFVAGQVREGASGDRLISYGTSSYGYDVRCADEFKVFTNIHSATVDPKISTHEALSTSRARYA